MSKNYLRAYCERSGTEQAAPGTPLRFVASTEGVKRDGKNLRAQDWRMDNYRSNPVVLWAHDYSGRNLPIGRAEPVMDGNRLMADVTFDQADEFARQVESKYRRGFCHAVSVGWNDVSEGGRTYHDLMDISAVPVPSDPMATMEQEVRALRELADELDQKHGQRGQRAPAGKTTIGNWLEAGVHGDFTDRCDWLFSTGVIDRDERIALSGGIGSALDVLSQIIDGTNDLRTRELEMYRAVAFSSHRGMRANAASENDAADECMAEQLKKYGDAKTAQKVCDAIKAQSESYKKDPKATIARIEKELGIEPKRSESVAIWNGVASAMLDLFNPATPMDEDRRRKLYNVLERAYRVFDKVPPEFRELKDLAVLCPAEVRGLFLEGEDKCLPEPQPFVEPEARAGAMLNARNRGDLEQAVTLIQTVLERAKTDSGNADAGAAQAERERVEREAGERAERERVEKAESERKDQEMLAALATRIQETQNRLGGQHA